ncbi:MAG: hypothetical protein IJ514_07030 [Clostridia bacterium]|nr:hypothetical protein [Clostridia bacterium]
MKGKIKTSILCLLTIILSSFSACFKQALTVQELTSDEQWYVGKWELSRITYIASVNPLYQLFYPAQGNGAYTVLFNEIGSEYWGRTSFMFSDNKINGEIDGYLQIGESIDDFKWSNAGSSRHRDTTMEFSQKFYFSGINGRGERIHEEVAILTDDNDKNYIYDDELVIGVNGLMIYVFVRAEEQN